MPNKELKIIEQLEALPDVISDDDKTKLMDAVLMVALFGVVWISIFSMFVIWVLLRGDPCILDHLTKLLAQAV